MPTGPHFFLPTLSPTWKNSRTEHCAAELKANRYFSDITDAIISRVKAIEIGIFNKQTLIEGKATPIFSDDFLTACLTRPLFRQQIERLLTNDIKLLHDLDTLIHLDSQNFSRLITLNSHSAYTQQTSSPDHREDIRVYQMETRHDQWHEDNRAKGLTDFFEKIPTKTKKPEQTTQLHRNSLFTLSETKAKDTKRREETQPHARSTLPSITPAPQRVKFSI